MTAFRERALKLTQEIHLIIMDPVGDMSGVVDLIEKAMIEIKQESEREYRELLHNRDWIDPLELS